MIVFTIPEVKVLLEFCQKKMKRKHIPTPSIQVKTKKNVYNKNVLTFNTMTRVSVIGLQKKTHLALMVRQKDKKNIKLN